MPDAAIPASLCVMGDLRLVELSAATIVAVDREITVPVTLAVSGVPVILHPETRVLDDVAMAAMTAFQADGTLVFSGDAGNALALEPGHVVVSAPTEAAPWGVLRRVSTVERSGDDWVVRTTEATLLDVFQQASLWGSILPAVWSFMLALRSRGLGSAWTTVHLHREKEVAGLLGIPAHYTQAGLFPVAYTLGTDFKPAPRKPLADVLHWNRW